MNTSINKSILSSVLAGLVVIVSVIIQWREILLLETGFVLGDYADQFYPWMHYLSQMFVSGELQPWTALNMSGLSVFGEGQMALLYWPNWILFKLLDFKTAYNYNFFIHYSLSLFTFFFLCKLRRMSNLSAITAVLMFGFGSALGGLFYGIFSLRPLTWFVIALVGTEWHCRRGSSAWGMVLTALSVSQMLLAGYPQMAVYGLMFLMTYGFFRLLELQYKKRPTIYAWFLAALIGGILIAWPQLMATYKWALASSRNIQDLEFVFWGSAAPWALLTVFAYPLVIIFRSQVFIGSAGILLLVGSDRNARCLSLFIPIVIAISFALGMYNPLNWLLAHIPGLPMMRNPSKFLYFVALFGALIAGLSLDNIATSISHANSSWIKRVQARMVFFISALWAMIGSVFAISRYGENLLRSLGRWYVEKFVYGKSFHPYTNEHYQKSIDQIIESMREITAIANWKVWLGFIIGSLFIVFLSLARKRCAKANIVKLVVFTVSLIELSLFIYSGYAIGGFGNVGEFPKSEIQKQLPKEGRWLDLTRRVDSLFSANRNMISGHASIGGYTPTANRWYSELWGGLGIVDDGMGRPVNYTSVIDLEPLLNFSGVEYAISSSPAVPDGWKKHLDLDRATVYKNEDAMTEIQWVGKVKRMADEDALDFIRSRKFNPMKEAVLPNDAPEFPLREDAEVHILESFDGKSLKIKTSQPILLMRNVIFDTNWLVTSNLDLLPTIRVNHAYIGVFLKKGMHHVTWEYQDREWVNAALFLALGLLWIAIIVAAEGVWRSKNPPIYKSLEKGLN